MKSYITTAVTVLAVLVLASGGLLVTHAATTQSLSMNLTGGVVNAGEQQYNIQQSGFAGGLLGTDQFGGVLTYTLNADVKGITTHGSASFQLVGLDANNLPVIISGMIPITGNLPAICLPSGTMPVIIATNIHKPQCLLQGTSEVPFFFLGTGQVQISVGGVSTKATIPMAFESAYFDPFRGLIVFGSADILTGTTAPSLSIVTTYNVATIDWSNGVEAGYFTGAVGTTSIVGSFQQVASEHEDLVAGTATDSGTITFSGVTDLSGNAISYMDGSGTYSGTSYIPTTGSTPCLGGVPYCTETGFQSSGSFQVTSGHGHNTASIVGGYDTTWSVPAFMFTSIVKGTVTQ
ncbi:MAG: hypothetical protein JRN20_03840 [Nitrososphaerota archaeon]|nr:hypothetical protein [Nitrososphaerota archaeon]